MAFRGGQAWALRLPQGPYLVAWLNVVSQARPYAAELPDARGLERRIA